MKTLSLGLAVLLVASGGPDYGKLLGEAKLTLVDAIDKAIAEAGGGVPVDACLEREEGKAAFEVAVAKDDRKFEILMSAVDGSFMAKSEQKRDHTALVAKFTTTLRQMILTAIERTGGKAVEAELHGRETPVASVATWANGRLTRVTLDAAGVILKVDEIKPAGFLGIEGKNADLGVRIAELAKDGPAAKAGLKVGDVITAINGKPVKNFEQVAGLVCQLGAGAIATVDYLREGQAAQVSVTLGARRGDDDDDDEDGDEDEDD